MKTIPSNITDDELSALVAEQVAGWKPIPLVSRRSLRSMWVWRDANGEEATEGSVPPYATSIDAVLPLLETNPKGWGCARKVSNRDYKVAIYGPEVFRATASTLARAICLSLLAAKGFTVTS